MLKTNSLILLNSEITLSFCISFNPSSSIRYIVINPSDVPTATASLFGEIEIEIGIPLNSFLSYQSCSRLICVNFNV